MLAKDKQTKTSAIAGSILPFPLLFRRFFLVILRLNPALTDKIVLSAILPKRTFIGVGFLWIFAGGIFFVPAHPTLNTLDTKVFTAQTAFQEVLTRHFPSPYDNTDMLKSFWELAVTK